MVLPAEQVEKVCFVRIKQGFEIRSNLRFVLKEPDLPDSSVMAGNRIRGTQEEQSRN